MGSGWGSELFAVFNQIFQFVCNILQPRLKHKLALTHLCRENSSTLSLWNSPFPVSGQCLSLPCFIDIPVLNANSEDPDQTPLSAASYLDLHCLPMFFFIGR